MRKSFLNKHSKKGKSAGLIAILLFFYTTMAFAQNAVTGKVTDVSGEALIGVNVLVKGTSNGTITDFDGKYTLQQVPAQSILTFSYVGYTSQEIAVENRRTIDVQLKDDMQRLDEVVVVGYGTQQKRDITGSVAVVDAKELLKSTGSSSMQQLQGKAAGVYIGTSGAPGSQTMVRIRGVNTVNDNGPLYVIDGVSTRNQDLSSLNPNDIESLQVLKDASSAAIYGAQAANGVILITTKKGNKSGQPTLTYDGYYTVQKTGKRYDLLNSQERLQLEWESQQNRLQLTGAGGLPYNLQFGSSANGFVIPNLMTSSGAGGSQNINPNDYSYPDNVMVPFSDTDWWSEIDRAAPIQSHQVSLSGGSDKGQYNMSVNYFDQEGTQIYTYYKKYTARANSSYNIRPWLRFGENLSYTWSKDLGRSPQGAEDTPYSWTYRATPWVPVYDIRGNFAGSKIGGTGNWQNPVALLTRNKDNYYSNSRIFGNLWGELDLMKGLSYRTSFGIDYTNNYSYRMSKKNLEFSESPKTNDLEESAGFNFRWVWSNTLTYNTTFNNVHKLNIILGTEAIRDGLGRSMTGRRFGYLYEDNVNTWTLTMGENNAQRVATSEYRGEFALFGIFGRADYAFKDKYLLTGIIRRDGVSRFAPSNRYGTFPSISLGWRVSEESFMASTKEWMDDLKLRVGYGQAGNSEVPRKTNFAYEYTTAADRTNYDFAGANTGGSLGFRLQRFGNEDTKWEYIENINVALDGTFANGKLGATLEYYNKTTRDMLVSAAYSSLAGEPDKPYINFGDVRNTGIEASFNYRDSRGDWSWEVNLNLTHYRNEVIKLAEADDYTIWEYGTRLDGQPVTRTTKGHPISEFYGYRVNGFYENVQEVLALQPLGQSLSAEEAKSWVGRFKFADINGNNILDVDDREVLGSPHPDLITGLNLSSAYKNFDFSMFWYSTIGNKMVNNTVSFTDFNLFNGNRSKRMLYESWKIGADNSKAVLPLLNDGDTYSRSFMSSYYVEDASFLRLKNIMVGYTFPKNILRKATIQNLRIYLQAENTLTFTKYSGLDPEFTNANVSDGDGADRRRGLDMGGWPNVMRFTFGLNFVF
jgi:TonB-linked SusC/RagA family outer membrane protein